MDFNKHQIWEILNNLTVVGMVAISPRPGVDFLQSLFDNHENIITFDGWLLFNEFYNKPSKENHPCDSKYLQKRSRFVKITKAGFYESMVHNVEVTNDGKNYKL